MIRSLFITVSLAIFLIFSQISYATDQYLNPAFQYALQGDLVELQQMDSSELAQQADHNGFTLIDYARINDHTHIIQWAYQQKIHSGVNKELIKRIQLWFYLLGVPVDNLNGVYNRAFAQNIVNFQMTRGYQTNRFITPDWYNDLEEEAILSLQGKLNKLGINTPLTGELDISTLSALQNIAIDKNQPLISQSTLSYLRDDDSYTPHLSRYIEKQKQIQKQNYLLNGFKNVQLAQEEIKKKPTKVKEKEPKKEIVKKPKEERETIFNFTRDEIDEILIAARSGNVLTVQTWLKLIGYFPHHLDGDMGPITREAIKKYQTSIGQKATGQLHPSWETILEKEIRKMTQAELKRIELYHSDIDGIDGISTRGAIESFERSQKIEETGSLSPHLLLALFNHYEIENADDKGKIEYAVAADEISTTPDSNRNIRLVTSSQRKTLSREKLIEGYTSTGNDHVALQQLMLAYLGYYDATIDGITGEQARVATKSFQKKNKLSEDGVIGGKTYQILRNQTITKFQRYLQESGYMEDDPTGTLGPKTRKAVVELKKRHNFKDLDHSLDIALLLILIDKEQHTNYHEKYQDYLVEVKKEEAFIKQLQSYLIAFDLLTGKADGIDGPATQKALQKFRASYKIDKKIGNNTELFTYFDKFAIKKGQQYLKELKHNIKVDGVWGKNTQEEMNKFLAKNKMDQAKELSPEILIAMKDAIKTHNNRINRRAPSKATASAPAQARGGTKVSMSSISRKGQQSEGMLSSAPKNRVSGRLELVRNKQGSVVGCRVNNISMGMRWCENQKNGSQCSIFYHNGRVLSLRCR